MNKLVGLVLLISFPAYFGAKLNFENGIRIESNRNAERFTIPQRLDHFNDSIEYLWWPQHFLINEEFSGGVANPPIFIYVNGDWDALETNTFLERGLIYDYARNVSGALIALDFRFSGVNVPTSSVSITNLQYSATEQGLEDVAELVRTIKPLIGFEESKFIVYGSSYGGNIAIWLRQKYPELFDGAWGAAAPLEAKYEVENFYSELGDVIRSVDQSCFDIFKIGLDQADELVNNGETAEVTRILNLCEDISHEHNTYYTFYYRFAEFITAFFTNASRFLINMTCGGINVPGLTELQRLGLFMRGTQNDTCFNINFPLFIAGLLNELPANRVRINFYQQCTEVGWFKSMNHQDDLFGERLTAANLSGLCSSIFDINDQQIDNLVESFNAKYGGTSPNVTNVYFTNGDFNPWRFLSVQNDLNELSPAVVIPDYGKLWELFSLTAGDSELNAAKQRGLDLISLWLS